MLVRVLVCFTAWQAATLVEEGTPRVPGTVGVVV